MKSLVFDTGPLISLAMNNLLWILKPMKQKFDGEFYITEAVRREAIERPLTSKKYKFEALQILKLVNDKIINVYTDKKLKTKTEKLLTLSNSLFKAHSNYVKNVQYAEVESIVASQILESSAVVVDEFITRTLLENPIAVQKRMERRLRLKVEADKENISNFKSQVINVKVIRSFEIVTIAYELGLFDIYIIDQIKHPKKTLLEGLLWALKLNGCSVSEMEILEALKLEVN